MQTNEIVGQAKPVARLPEMDEAPIAKHPMLNNRWKRPDAPRAAAVKQAKAAAGSNRHPRRFGAGF